MSGCVVEAGEIILEDLEELEPSMVAWALKCVSVILTEPEGQCVPRCVNRNHREAIRPFCL